MVTFESRFRFDWESTTLAVMIFVVEPVDSLVSIFLLNNVDPLALFMRKPPLATIVGVVTACAGAAVRAPPASTAPAVTVTAAALRKRLPLMPVMAVIN